MSLEVSSHRIVVIVIILHLYIHVSSHSAATRTSIIFVGPRGTDLIVIDKKKIVLLIHTQKVLDIIVLMKKQLKQKSL